MNFTEQIFARSWARILRRGSKSEERDASLRGCKIPRAFGACRNVRAERFAFLAGNYAKSEKLQILFANVLSAHLSSRFKVSMAVRIQVFTVPNGAPVRPAISLWDMPSK